MKKIHNFFQDGASGVKILVFCVCGLISLYSWLYLWFLIGGLVQVFFFLSLVVNF